MFKNWFLRGAATEGVASLWWNEACSGLLGKLQDGSSCRHCDCVVLRRAKKINYSVVSGPCVQLVDVLTLDALVLKPTLCSALLKHRFVPYM